MKSFFKFLILLACLLLPVIAFARDTSLPQVLDLGGGFSISLPVDWTVSTNKDGAATVTSNDFGMTILAPTYVDALGLNLTARSDVVKALIDIDALPPNPLTIKTSDVQKVSYGDRTAAVYSYTIDNTTDGMDLVIPMGSGAPGYLALAANKGQFTAQSSTISAIITSFDKSGSSATGTEEAGSTSAASGGSAVNCTVSADTANSAQLRVGPGTNRGAISFLPAGVEVTVTGRTQLANKSVWYQLDKSEAAPKGTSAAQLWVAATDVSASGDCDHVGDASAPPVIPGNVAPPPATNGTGNPGAGDQSAAPGAMPANGQWTMTFNATTNASCVGYENVPIPSEQVLEAMSYTYPLRVSNSGAFVYGSDTYTRVPGTNTFTGLFTWRDGTQSQAWLTVNSTTSINGQLIDNFTLDNNACSGTFLFLAVHR